MSRLRVTGVVWPSHLGFGRMTARLTQGPRLVLIAGGAIGLGVLIVLWPALVAAIGLVALVTAVAWRAPEYGFVLALVLFGFEGTLKKELTFETLPSSLSGSTLGAGVLDLSLLVAGAVLLVRRRSSLKAAWAGADRLLRIGLLLLAAWLVLAVIEIPQSGHLTQGLNGFRLIHWYVLALAGGVLLARSGRRGQLDLLLGLVAVVAAYGALRGVIGPSAEERAFALSRPGVALYGSAFRDVGSFSGAVGLASYLAPAAIFGFVLALLIPRLRFLGIALAVFGLVAVIDSYARAAIVAMFLAVVAATAVILRTGRTSRRVTLTALAAILLALALGTVLVSRSSPEVRTRLHVFVHPLADESVHLRLSTWKESLNTIVDHPLGSGVGTVGRATTLPGQTTVTTDNSYLEILREQGFLGGALFMLGILVTLAAVASGIGRAPAHRRPLAIAAGAAFLCFVVLSAAGEYIEQPGKVLAWTLLGIAVGVVSMRPSEATSE